LELIERLRRRRDRLQQQLDRWISRGFRGGGKNSSDDATPHETANKVSEVADLNRLIAEQKTKDREIKHQ
jgi:hypothetical protein